MRANNASRGGIAAGPKLPKAAMVPLDYQNRTEHSVIYYSGNWGDLVDLLEVPYEYLRTQQHLWPQTPMCFNWKFNRPITAVLNSAYKSEYAMALMAKARGLALDGGSPKKTGAAQAVDTKSISTKLTKLLKQHEFAGEGHFIVEFAINTATMFVHVTPPPDSPEPNHDNHMTDPTLATMTSDVGIPELKSMGHLHLDLRMPDPMSPRKFIPADARLRAQWAVDCLQSRKFLEKFLNANKNVHKPPVVLQEPSTIQHITTYAPVSGLKFEVPDDPLIVIEGLSSDTLCCVCTDSTTLEGDGTVLVTDTIIKNYCDPIHCPSG
jgi:hypothetical protein